MRLALPIKEGLIVKRPEEAESVLLLDTEENEILSSEEIPVLNNNIIEILKEHDVDTFICTSLSTRLMIELARNNIEIVGGVRGNAIREAKKYLLGEVEENDFILDCGDVNCSGDCSKCH